MTVHLPDTFNPDQTAGTACGLIFGIEPWSADDDAVITNTDERGDVDCPNCLQMEFLAEEHHLSSVPHPQPVKVRVYELAKEAGVEKSQPVLDVLGSLGYDAKAPASALDLEGFEHEALVAMLGDL